MNFRKIIFSCSNDSTLYDDEETFETANQTSFLSILCNIEIF